MYEMLSALLLSIALHQGLATTHPLFTIDSDVIKRSYGLGRDMCKRKAKPTALVAGYYKEVGKVRSPAWQHWQAPYAVFCPPLLAAELLGFEDQRQYNDTSNLDKVIELYKAVKKPEERHIRFIVNLYAWPGVNDYNGAVNRVANAQDVKNVHFVMIVDGDADHAIHPLIAPTQGETEAGTGTYDIPEYHTVYGSSITSTPYGSISSSSTYSFYTERLASYNYYRCAYNLAFPLYDKEGKPYITPQTKTITLKIIYPTGEHSATYTLSDYTIP